MAKYPQIKRKIVVRHSDGTESETPETIAANKSMEKTSRLRITGVLGFNRARQKKGSTTWAFDGFVKDTLYAEAYEYDPKALNGVGQVVLKSGYKIKDGYPVKEEVVTTAKTKKSS